jgi:pimeloyl-ACP methyl ester carboxylesterase
MRWRHHRRAEAIARYAELVLEKDLGKSAMSDRILFEQLHDRVALLQDVQEAWQHVGEGIYYDGRALSRYAWRLEGIDVPIDIWQGNADTIWTPETAIALKDSNKAAQIHLLRNEGHLIYLTRWQEIVERGMYYLK